MTRRYGHPVSAVGEMPTGHVNGGASCSQRFVWRGATYHVAEILATWHLRDCW